MKQLLHTCDDYAIVGLYDHAYIIHVSGGNKVIELLPPPLPTPSRGTKPTHADEAEQSASVGSESQPKDDSKQPQQAAANDDSREIEAVAITKDENGIEWCAVSRNDKSLAIYELGALAVDETENSPKPAALQPITVYNTPKRVGCLCFATLPGADNGDSDKKKPTSIVVAGDLNGDAYAYSLQEKRQRLLLGHTASILTGICVSRNRIMTADRDEKIRVSLFPETHAIIGFLFGHEAYVSAIDVVADDSERRLIASCGGDGTIRLWNIETLQQVAQISVNEVEEEQDNESSNLIPTNIAIDPEGTLLAVVFDQISRVDLYRVEVSDDEKTTMRFVESKECPSQTLSVTFQNKDELMVLMQDPDYLAVFQNVQSSATITSVEALCQVASKENIVMPLTILEKDKHGQPKLQKLEETRGPSGADAPWNRVGRVEVAKNRERRAKKRRHLK
jgi:tRNA (guanine-N(7)-)-methyltransferase subunit TRM82